MLRKFGKPGADSGKAAFVPFQTPAMVVADRDDKTQSK